MVGAREKWARACAWRRQARLLGMDNTFSHYSLTKDMTGKEDNYRGPAVRTLCQITDVSLLFSASHPPLFLLFS